MTTKKSAEPTTEKKDETFSEDAFGVVHFHGRAVGDTYHAKYHNPFEWMLEHELNEASPTLKDAARELYDDLYVCRTIAVSIYGRRWAEHVIEVYDRLRANVHAAAAREAAERGEE